MGAWPIDDLDNSNIDQGTDDPSAARADLNALMVKVQAILAARADASGVCDLDASTKIPSARLPTIGVSQGGTGVTNVPAQGMLVGNGTSPLQIVTPGTSGQVFTSQGSGAPPNWTSVGLTTAGTKIWFYQAAAPSGWSIDVSTSDAVLGVGISGDTNGTLNGSWATDTDSYQLVIADMPAHDHAGSTADAVGNHQHGPGNLEAQGNATPADGGNRFVSGTADDASERPNLWNGGATAASGGHGHNLTVVPQGGDTAHVHNMSGWRPKRHSGIICIKL